MKTLFSLTALAVASLAVATPAAAQGGGARYNQAQDEEARFDAAQQRFDAELATFQAAFERYQQWRQRNRGGRGPDPRYDDRGYEDDYRDDPNYDPARYYRAGPNYQERVLGPEDRIYRGRDGRYYCRRSDGTTGLIVGAVAGGVLGNLIDGGRSRAVGTILGALAGGAAGASIDRNNQQVRCR